VPIVPESLERREGKLLLRNYLGELIEYPDIDR